MTARHPSRRAVTLVEALIALAIGLTVVGAAVELMRFAARSFHQAEARLDPRERALSALLTARACLSDAVAAQPGAARLTFADGRGRGELAFDATAGRLSLRRPGERAATALVATGLSAFDASWKRPGLLRLTLAFADRTFTDEVWLPAVGLRTSDQPFHP